MSNPLLFFALAAASSMGVGEASDKLNGCVISKVDEFSSSGESAETIATAALAACLTERADLRAAVRSNMLKTNPSISKAAEAESYEMIVGAVRDDALVRIVTTRAKNAKD